MLIKVKVFPGSKKERILRKSEDSFEVNVKGKPEKGLANRGVTMILSAYFKIPESRVRLIKGFKSRNKVFKIN
jgi:uncharacterized protein (TIGR00251 family)